MRVLIKIDSFIFTGIVNHFDKLGGSRSLLFDITVDGTLENHNYNGDWVYSNCNRIIEPCLGKLFYDHLVGLNEWPEEHVNRKQLEDL